MKEFHSVRIKLLDEILPKFLAWQEQLIASIDEANGLPLEEMKADSLFDHWVKHNLLSYFNILPAHERQYLCKAEKVKKSILYRAVIS